MTLKNSFLTDAFENMKRRNWVFWISFLTFFCYFPGALVLGLNNIKSSYSDVTNPESLSRLNSEMNSLVSRIFHVNGVVPVFIIGLAILIGMQGFVYLHNKRQVDFYHSQPVSRKRRFLVLWVNGIAVFAVTYLVNMLLGMLVAAVYGRMSGAILSGALQGFILYLALFLGIYHISMIAVLLTGNTLVSLLAMVVLLGYELGARAMKIVLAGSFFITLGQYESEKILDTFLSPIVTIYKYIVAMDSDSIFVENPYTYGNTLIGLLVLAALFGMISFILYVKRASESHGSSISFRGIKEPLRFLLLLLIGTFGSYIIYYIAGESIALAIVGAVFFTALGHAVIQLIYEVDFRAIRKKWMTAAVSLVAVILVFLGFKYDWTGYDYRIPKQSKVESVYLDLVADGFCSSNHIMPDGSEIYRYSYAKNTMKLTDLDTVYELLENRELIKQTTRDFNGNYEHINIIFHLKNGKTESRNLYFKYEENLGVLDKIYHMDEYQLANNQVMEENFVEDYNIVSATYDNGITEFEVPASQVKALVEAYQKDVKNGSYTEVYYNIPVGKFVIKGIGLRNPEYLNSWEVVIYDSYRNTIALLEKAGIQYKAVFDEEYIDTIQKIEVSFTDYEKLEQSGPEAVIPWEECHKTITYKDKETFAKILEDAVPSRNRWWSNNNRSYGTDYYVYIYIPHFYDDNYCDEVHFQTGELPDFVWKDLENATFGEETVIE